MKIIQALMEGNWDSHGSDFCGYPERESFRELEGDNHMVPGLFDYLKGKSWKAETVME